MSEQTKNPPDHAAFMVTAVHGGESVHTIAVWGKDLDWAMSAEERERELLRAIQPLAVEKFGGDVKPEVLWVRGTQAHLKMGDA